MTAIAHQKSTFTGSEANSKQLLGLIVVVVLLLHLLMVFYVRNLAEPVKQVLPEKIMQVSLLEIPKPKPKPIVEPPPPPPAKPAPAKVVPVKKPPVKPPVKKIEKPVIKPIPKPTPSPVVHKQGEILKSAPTPEPIVRELIPPMPVMPIVPIKPVRPAPVVQAAPAPSIHKPSEHASENGHGSSSGVVELGCRKPKYPERAMERHIEGKVTVELTVDADGEVTNARVTKSEPDGVFDDAALNSAESCKFKPKIVNGAAVPQRATKTISFRLPPQ
jgi:protein TonB